MKQKHSFNFMIGLLIGGLVGLLIWYWQKSTSAEDGALALLDKLAATERRVRQLKRELDESPTPELLRHIPLPSRQAEVPSFLAGPSRDEADDLTVVKGIGAVFNGRLHQAGIQTLAALTALSAENLAEILAIRLGRAENILAEAKTHS